VPAPVPPLFVDAKSFRSADRLDLTTLGLRE
jgi:hypothetical protein